MPHYTFPVMWAISAEVCILIYSSTVGWLPNGAAGGGGGQGSDCTLLWLVNRLFSRGIITTVEERVVQL